MSRISTVYSDARLGRIMSIKQIEFAVNISSKEIDKAYEDNFLLVWGKQTGMHPDEFLSRKIQAWYHNEIQSAARDSWKRYCQRIENLPDTASLQKTLRGNSLCQLRALLLSSEEMAETTYQVLEHLIRAQFSGSELSNTTEGTGHESYPSGRPNSTAKMKDWDDFLDCCDVSIIPVRNSFITRINTPWCLKHPEVAHVSQPLVNWIWAQSASSTPERTSHIWTRGSEIRLIAERMHPLRNDADLRAKRNINIPIHHNPQDLARKGAGLREDLSMKFNLWISNCLVYGAVTALAHLNPSPKLTLNKKIKRCLHPLL